MTYGTPFTGTPYSIVCNGCGMRTQDDGVIAFCPMCGEASLLETEYQDGPLEAAPGASGLFRYRDWLPVRQEVPGSSVPAVYRCRGLGSALGLSELWVAFSGYWPERGCHMESGTFKELEAFTVLARTPADAGVMVIASAGNTAAAFAVGSRDLDFPCVLIVPERALPALAVPGGVGKKVRIIGVKDATYNDAIAFSRAVTATSPEFFAEGGVRNVGRRDGLAVVLLAAFEEMGALPDYYVQGVGSGAGAIAVDQAARRIVAAGGSGTTPRLLLCQNTEFAPLHALWRSGKWTSADGAGQREAYAPELLNATPPFHVLGGVRQILTHSSGDVLVADRREALAAAALFEETEGIDIEPAASMAVACLRRAVDEGQVPRDARILLNVTGGGRRRVRAELAAGDVNAWVVGRESAPEVIAAELLDSLA
ncbi:cysteate synthase [Kitasatospora sp. NPDC004289]